MDFLAKKEEWIASKDDVGKFTSSVKNYRQKNVLEILNFYKKHNRDNLYIFPILDESYKTPTQIHNRIKRALKTYNGHLKIVAEQVGISSTLTSYVSRHSWATILKRKGVSTSVISEGLGHSNEGVTQTYLDSFENETLDSINELLL